MQTTRLLLSLVLTSVFGPALAADGGLNVPTDTSPWPRLQSRLAIGTAPQGGALDGWLGDAAVGNRLASASVVGDWYFARPQASGGFRATGGLVFGSGSLWMARPPLGGGNSGLTVDRRAVLGTDAGDSATLPYLGLGYSGLLGAGRFGFSADLGLVARAPGNAVKFGRVLGGTQNLDELVRDLRLAPVLQLGVSYAF